MKTRRAWYQLAVEERGEGVYLVESEANNAPYTVDLSFNFGRGACDCPDFRFRWAKFYVGKMAELRGDNGLFFGACKHILRSHLYASIQSNLTRLANDPSANYHGP